MKNLLLSLTIAILAVVFVAAQQPKPEIVMDAIIIEAEEGNEYFKDWIGTVHPGGQVLSIQCPMFKDLPEDMKLSCKVDFNGQTVIDFISSICDALDDESIGKGVLEYAEPKGTFPEECPFTGSDAYKITEYAIPNDKLPPDTKPGPIEANIKIFSESEDKPHLSLKAIGEIVVR